MRTLSAQMFESLNQMGEQYDKDYTGVTKHQDHMSSTCTNGGGQDAGYHQIHRGSRTPLSRLSSFQAPISRWMRMTRLTQQKKVQATVGSAVQSGTFLPSKAGAA